MTAGQKSEGRNSGLTAILQAVATKLNLTPTQLITQLLSGKSLAEVAQSQQVNLSEVKAGLVDSLQQQLAQAIQQGKVTQSQAAKAGQTVELWFGEAANLHLSDLKRFQNLDKAGLFKKVLAATANSLNLSQTELTGQLAAGKSLAQIAQAQQVPLAKVKDATLGSIQAQVKDLVQQGTLTTVQAGLINQTAALWWDEVAIFSRPKK
jgi:DNA-binding CsgD family transcriptional regulator